MLTPSHTSPHPPPQHKRVSTPIHQGPRLKMMNALARSTGVTAAVPTSTVGSFTSAASVGGGSNAGSASIPSPELRSSPQQHQSNPNPASSLSPSDWSFPIGGGEGGLGLSAAAAAANGGGNSSSGSTPRLGAERDAHRATRTSGDVGMDVSSINLAGDDELGSSAPGSPGATAAGAEVSSEGRVAVAASAADAGEGARMSPPADADVWVASALSNAEDVVDGGDGSP